MTAADGASVLMCVRFCLYHICVRGVCAVKKTGYSSSAVVAAVQRQPCFKLFSLCHSSHGVCVWNKATFSRPLQQSNTHRRTYAKHIAAATRRAVAAHTYRWNGCVPLVRIAPPPGYHINLVSEREASHDSSYCMMVQEASSTIIFHRLTRQINNTLKDSTW